MDAFFAAIEERNNPQFSGMPIVVGSDPREGRGRGVVSTANYKAREYGIHSAMAITKAWRLSQYALQQGKPAAVFLPGSFQTYSRISKSIMEVIKQHTPTMQQRSVDEAYFDLSNHRSLLTAENTAKQIKQAIYEKEQLTCSVGIGPNKLVAKIGSDMNKPDGLVIITEAEAQARLAPLSIRAIPGVGPKTQLLLARCDIRTVADAQQYGAEELESLLGKWGSDLYNKVRGIDASPLYEYSRAKSISEQITLREDTLEASILIPQMFSICDYLIERLHEDGFKSFRTLGITARFSNFTTRSRQTTLAQPTADAATLRTRTLQLLLPFFDSRENPQHELLRLVGVKIEKLK